MQTETRPLNSLDEHKQFDNPDLWVKFQAAKERLYTETDFPIRYRVSSSSPPETESPVAETGSEEPEEREPEKSSLESALLSEVASVKLPTVNPARSPVATPNHHPDKLPSSQQQPASEKQNNGTSGSSSAPVLSPVPDAPPEACVKIAHPSIALYIAPHLRDPAARALRPPQRYRTSRPFRPIPIRSEPKQNQISSEVPSTFFKSHLVTPLPNPSRLREEVRPTPVQPRSRSPSLEAKQDITPQDTDETQTKKMSDTDSDEIMLARGNKFRGRQEPPVQAESSRQAEERALRKSSKSRKPAKLQLESHGPSEQQENTQQGKAPRGPSASPEKTKEEDNELQRLREAIVQKAHCNRFKNIDCDTANPEALPKCRDGPGTDRKSEFYRIMARRRRAGRVATVIEKAKPASSTDSSSDAEEVNKVVVDREAADNRYVAQWDAYLESPHIYPIVEDGDMHLSRTPTAEQKQIAEQMSRARVDPSSVQVDKDMPRPDNKWADAYYADWEYRPRAYSSLEAFRDWFRRWLDTTTQICYYVDICHEAFFDGTAHPDGVQAMYIPSLDDDEICRDASDEMTMLHAHENAEGYSHNFVLHSRKQAEEAQLRKELNRKAYLEAMNAPPRDNPNSPKANIFLRPAQLEDSRGILKIMNWYAESSTLSTDIQRLETGDVRQRIENCQENKLPFIVAVERNTGAARDSSPEKILGYALANDSVGFKTSGRFTAELHVFVKNGYKRQGIGRCLMDKLLEVCDPTYIPKFGYVFNAAFDDQPKYRTGGCRRLARLIFTVGYQSDRGSEVQWLKDWLLDKYEFEEQAVLKGSRVKFDHFNDVSYLVRSVGYSPNIRFEY